jgi:plasmid segregation protein ParM
LGREKIYEADVFLAAGLPLTWVGQQKDAFKQYLLQNKTVEFTFRRKDYRIRIVGADLYPQGFAAIINNLADFSGVNMLCDIGNGTMNVMFVTNKKPDPTRCFTEKFGTHQCTLQVRENLLREHGVEPPEELITQVLRFGTADMDAAYLKTITDTAREYTIGIFRRLQEHGYDRRLMRLYVVGGGGALIRNFAEYEPDRVTINGDICATAKGYERMAEMKLLRGDKL